MHRCDMAEWASEEREKRGVSFWEQAERVQGFKGGGAPWMGLHPPALGLGLGLGLPAVPWLGRLAMGIHFALPRCRRVVLCLVVVLGYSTGGDRFHWNPPSKLHSSNCCTRNLL